MICKICKNPTKINLTKIKNIYNNYLYEIYECKFCNLSFTKDEKKFQINEFYKNTYDYDINEIIIEEKIWRIKKNYKKIKKIINLSKNSLVLDIGCMHGFFLEYLNKIHGCKCDGIELDSFNSVAKNKSDINIFKQNLFEFSAKIENFNKYDFIILNHSLEHFVNPLLVIDSVSKLLKKDGFCYIAVPNFKSKISYLTKKYWGWLQPVVHYYHFNPSGLTRMIENKNFNINFMSSQGGDSLFIFLTLFNIISSSFKIKIQIYKKSYLKNLIIKLSSLLLKYMYYIGNDESLLLFKNK